jgi:hypothetical protein
MFVAEMSVVRVYLCLNPDVKGLGSAHSSYVTMLDRTVTVGHEGDEPLLLYHGRNMCKPTTNE